MVKIIKILFAIFFVVFLVSMIFPFFIKAPQQNNMVWGVNFSKEQAQYLALDWKKNYLDILDDLQVHHLKLFSGWDTIENKKGEYDFKDMDWQLQEAQTRGTDVIYVAGMKSGRWPECHLPDWANNLSKEDQQDAILEYLETTINHYKNDPVIIAWQAENEPLFNFGICPWYDKDFLKKEVALIKVLDPTRPVIISDSGEQSLWISAATIGDIVGTTMYRKVWLHINEVYGFYVSIPIPPSTYWLKAQLIKKLFNKEVINIELQAEPWTPNNFYSTSLPEQAQTMNADHFKETIAYAKQSGLPTFYFWGAEWWYWMKEKHHDPSMWNEAKLFLNNQAITNQQTY